jgi:hypothetical protein
MWLHMQVRGPAAVAAAVVFACDTEALKLAGRARQFLSWLMHLPAILLLQNWFAVVRRHRLHALPVKLVLLE